MAAHDFHGSAAVRGAGNGTQDGPAKSAESCVPPPSLRVLLVEDQRADAELMLRELRRAGYDVIAKRVETEPDYIAELVSRPDIILADYSLPRFGALAALDVMHSHGVDIPVIVVTGSIRDEAAAACIRLGAADYLLKDRLSRLPEAVRQALEKKRLCEEQARADRALRSSERLKDTIIRSALDGVVTIDRDGNIVEFNPAAEAIFGRARSDVHGRQMVEMIVPPRFREAHQRGFARLLETGEGPILGKRFELVASRADGTEFPIELAVTATGSWEAPLFTAFIRDISQRRTHEQKIRRLNRVHAVLSGINALIVRVRDRQQLFDAACRIAVEQGQFELAWIGILDRDSLEVATVASAGPDAESFGRIRATARENTPEGRGVVGRAIRAKKAVYSNDLAAEMQNFGPRRTEALRRGFRSVITLPLLAGEAVVGNLSLYSKEPDFFDDDEVKLLSELAGDIAFALQTIERQEQLDYLSRYDVLTGLSNRAVFQDRLEQALSGARQSQGEVAVALCDIKRFRLVNETLGRTAGDSLLRELARRLVESWPDPANVTRVSADRFAAFTVAPASDVARLLEDGLYKSLAAPFTVAGSELSIGMALGIAIYPNDADAAETLINNAEAALRKAQASGERYLFYQAEMNARVAESLRLENRMRRALEKEQFVLHYQPKIDLASGRISGVEALIRWNDPETGLVPPGMFIPLLEETGLILEVGQWAMRKAMEDHRAWRAQGLRAPRIAVNVSPIQLRRKDFVAAVSDAIGTTAAGDHSLDLEITESMIMEDVEGNIEKLRAIRQMGVSIAIDDFGTGYSSLGYLAKLPVNQVKIDRSFIMNMTSDPDNMTIVSAIVSLAHSLNLKVIAEGVETDEQARYLRLLNCDQAQGYVFSRPVPAAEIEKKLAAEAL